MLNILRHCFFISFIYFSVNIYAQWTPVITNTSGITPYFLNEKVVIGFKKDSVFTSIDSSKSFQYKNIRTFVQSTDSLIISTDTSLHLQQTFQSLKVYKSTDCFKSFHLVKSFQKRLFNVDSVLIKDSSVYVDTIIYSYKWQYREVLEAVERGKIVNKNKIYLQTNLNKLYRTTDGGLNWDSTQLDKNYSSGLILMKKIKDTLIDINYHSQILKSGDKGKTWKLFTPVLHNSFDNSVFYLNEFIWYDNFIGYGFAFGGSIIEKKTAIVNTVDGGKTWNAQFFLHGDLRSPRFLSMPSCNQVYLSFYDKKTDDVGIFLVTTNGGSNWSQFYHPKEKGQIRNIIFDKFPNGTMVTQNSEKSGATIFVFKTSNGGIKNQKEFSIKCENITDIEIQNVENNINSIIYPNPVIEFFFVNNISGIINVELFNSFGEKITFEIEPLNNYYKCNISHCPQGYYYLKITNSFGNKTYKIIKIE